MNESFFERIIIAGLGGQGVLSLGQTIAKAGMEEGRQVTWLPSYGPEMRGGTSDCQIILSDTFIAAPVIEAASACIILNETSLERFEYAVEDGGLLVINESIVRKKVRNDTAKTAYVPANEIAEELGNVRIANMVMLGAFLAMKPIVKVKTIIQQLKLIFGEQKAHLIPINQKAIECGAAAVDAS